MNNELYGQALYIASKHQYGVVVDRIADEHGFQALYVVAFDDGDTAALHEDRLFAAGLIERTRH